MGVVALRGILGVTLLFFNKMAGAIVLAAWFLLWNLATPRIWRSRRVRSDLESHAPWLDDLQPRAALKPIIVAAGVILGLVFLLALIGIIYQQFFFR